jgi:hypothetical protein
MTVLRLAAKAATLLLFLAISAKALTSDEEVDAMLSTAAQYDAAGKGRERDALDEEVRIALRGRLAADSSSGSALARLDRLEELSLQRKAELKAKLAELRAKAAKGDTSTTRSDLKSLKSRFPAATIPQLSDLLTKTDASPTAPPPLAAPVAAAPTSDSCRPGDSCSDPDSAIEPRPVPPSEPRALQPRCPDGAPQVRILSPSPSEPVTIEDSALVLQIRLVAPCPLGRVTITRDSTLVRILNLPATPSGSFELDDAIGVTSGSRLVSVTACDTFRTCARAELSLRPPQRIPPWIPWTSGGLILLGLATGVFALFRRPSAPVPPGDSKQARGLSVRIAKPKTATNQPTDIQESLRSVIAEAEKEAARGPRLISRMNTAIPAVDADPQQLQAAFRSLLKLPLLRAGLRGTVLVATGRGPVNMEVVLEDNGPDIEDASVRTLFDAGVKNRERQGLDKELAEAADILGRLHGHLAAEPRIDGGLRLRIRLPLPSASGPRAASLLK